jgi:hypothetical protein
VKYWIYTAVAGPTITYAATVWRPKVKIKTSHAELTKLQRMTCLGITGAMRTAPRAAIEVLLGLPLLHMLVEAEAKAGNYRRHCTMINGNPNPKVLAMHTWPRT